MEEEIIKLKQKVELLENILADFSYSDRYIFQKHLQIMDGRNIQLATGTGTRIGTTTGQKLGLFNATPVIQASAISAPTTQGGIYVQADVQSIVTAVNAIRVALTNIGITA